MFGKLKLFIIRIFRSIRNIPFFIKKSFMYEYETCNKCGIGYRLLWNVKDEIWMQVFNTDSGCYCPTCFIEVAEKKGIYINDGDIEIKPFYEEKYHYPMV